VKATPRAASQSGKHLVRIGQMANAFHTTHLNPKQDFSRRWSNEFQMKAHMEQESPRILSKILNKHLRSRRTTTV